MIRHDFYVYALLRPPKCGGPGPFVPFYIGKGCGRRVSVHGRVSTRERSRKASICRKLMKEIGHVPHAILLRSLTEGSAHRCEVLTIRHYGRQDARTGILANMTDGGEGASGSIKTPEMRARHSEILKVANATTEARANKSAGLKKYIASSPAARATRSDNARKMHSVLGDGWVSGRNKRAGAAMNAAREPQAREARTLRAGGMKAYQIAERMGLSTGTAYRLCGPVFDYLDEATEPAAKVAA